MIKTTRTHTHTYLVGLSETKSVSRRKIDGTFSINASSISGIFIDQFFRHPTMTVWTEGCPFTGKQNQLPVFLTLTWDAFKTLQIGGSLPSLRKHWTSWRLHPWMVASRSIPTSRSMRSQGTLCTDVEDGHTWPVGIVSLLHLPGIKNQSSHQKPLAML